MDSAGSIIGHLAFSGEGEGVMFCALVSIPVSIVDEPEYDQNYGVHFLRLLY